MRTGAWWVALAGISVVLGSIEAADSVIIDIGPAPTGFSLATTESGSAELQLTLSELRLDAVDIDGQSWAVVRAPGAANLMGRGEPSLPYLTTEYLLGRRDGIRLEVIDRVERDVDLTAYGFAGVAPSKGHFDRSVDPDTVPWTFDARVYGGTETFPAAGEWLGAPFISGPTRGQVVGVVAARWEPMTNLLRVVEKVRYRVVEVAESANPRTGPDRPLTSFSLNTSRAVNATREVRSVAPGRLLILAYDAFVDEVQPLADWETLVGYPTLLVPLSTVGTTAAQVKTYIQGLYDAPEGLAWIILVGDAAQVPTLTGVNEGADCDPCYTKLEGADNRPDAAISRISAQTAADVTTQVNKFITYEQYPDTGSAATWYSSAFGIGGDDTGGSPSYYDWERIDMLRVDLVTPAYTFTEFDQLYHSPTKAQISASVNGGTSLGFYIGHGADTYWVTSGFSTTDAHALTNGDMLPVIWDVACVNGNFVDNSECFAEAWLREDQGGAVSFEAATTNESWVPPCDAQRGVVDAIRQETDFTTGGQHVAGKQACMDINGDANASEGTLFMEQSTLFGSVVLWPRTTAPSLVDEPTDFALAGGVASLTVKVGGVALAKLGGAIVSFLDAGGNPVGSGLIGANGVVSAAVTGDPAQCHIHGHNLIPATFELAAQPDGQISLSGALFTCTDVVTIRVTDSNVPGASPSVVDTVSVGLGSGIDSATVILTESAVDNGAYVGTATLGTDLTVAHGVTLTATYQDADTGGGSPATKTATAVLDCQGPVISAVHTVNLTGSSATVEWTTDEAADSLVTYGLASSPPPALSAGDAFDVVSHSVPLTGLAECTNYSFRVASADPLGQLSVADNSGGYFRFQTPMSGNETFAASDTPVAIPDPGTAVSTISVPLGATVVDVDVTLSITHTYDWDLNIFLVSPSGTRVELSTSNGGSGNNYTATVFDDEASGSITAGTAPFTGSFQPETPLAAVDGQDALGDWKLEVADVYGTDSGSITSWALTLTFPAAGCNTLFANGFETGGTGGWSSATP